MTYIIIAHSFPVAVASTPEVAIGLAESADGYFIICDGSRHPDDYYHYLVRVRPDGTIEQSFRHDATGTMAVPFRDGGLYAYVLANTLEEAESIAVGFWHEFLAYRPRMNII